MTVESLTPILFYVFAGVAVAAALVMITQKSPIGSAFALIVVLCSLSAIYGLLGSPFIAALQIVVYAGAVMVLFLFVIMLLKVRREADVPGGQPMLRAAAIGFVAVMVVEVSSVGAADAHPRRAAVRRLHRARGPGAVLARSCTPSRRPPILILAAWSARSPGEEGL